MWGGGERKYEYTVTDISEMSVYTAGRFNLAGVMKMEADLICRELTPSDESEFQNRRLNRALKSSTRHSRAPNEKPIH